MCSIIGNKVHGCSMLIANIPKEVILGMGFTVPYPCPFAVKLSSMTAPTIHASFVGNCRLIRRSFSRLAGAS